MLKQSTIEKLRNSQSAAQVIWNDLMAMRENECKDDVVATSEDVSMLVYAAIRVNQAVRLIELLRYRHDPDFEKEG